MVYSKIDEINSPLDEVSKALNSDNKKTKGAPKNMMKEYIKVMLIRRVDDLIAEAVGGLKIN